MASLKAISTKKKKVEAKPTPQRKSGAAKVLEEKHVGAEITNWSGIRDMDNAIYQCLRHYGYFYDHKDAFKWGEAWVKKNRTASELADYKASEDWRVNTTLGGLCKMHMNGAELEESAEMKRVNLAFTMTLQRLRVEVFSAGLSIR